jgi:hypothetical protein
VRGIFAALALSSLVAGCADDPAGIVLVFPSDAQRLEATGATIKVIKPQPNDCTGYLKGDPVPTALVGASRNVVLKDGKADKPITGLPNGNQTVLALVQGLNGILFLHGCKTGTLATGQTFELPLQGLNGDPDLKMDEDDMGPVDDLAGPPPDMAVHHTLTITATELRTAAANRKLVGVSVTVTDALGVTTPAVLTDSTGAAKVEVTGMMSPLSITASAPVMSGFSGAATLSGIVPNFTADNINIAMPIELDPPATGAGNVISVTVGGATTENFDVYFNSANSVATDIKKVTGQSPLMVGPLVANSSYRIAVVQVGADKISTPSPVTSSGGSYSPALTSFVTLANNLQINYTASTDPGYNSQKYAVNLVLPASSTQAPVPIVSPAPLAGSNVMGLKVPAMASAVQAAAVIVTEITADGASAHAELRHQLAATTPASDTFGAVPAPPTLTVNPPPSPSPVPAAMPISVSAIPPASFPLSAAFVHIHIHDGAGTFHWHLLAPAANPTAITVPGGVLPIGTYTMDVAFVQLFTLPTGTVQATLTDDYTKLLRPLPAQLTQSTVNLLVN